MRSHLARPVVRVLLVVALLSAVGLASVVVAGDAASFAALAAFGDKLIVRSTANYVFL